MAETNGNGNAGYTVKEFLARIEKKVDDIAADLAAVKLDSALTKARVTTLEQDEDDRDGRVSKLEGRFNSVLAGIGTGLFAGAILFVRSLGG